MFVRVSAWVPVARVWHVARRSLPTKRSGNRSPLASMNVTLRPLPQTSPTPHSVPTSRKAPFRPWSQSSLSRPILTPLVLIARPNSSNPAGRCDPRRPTHSRVGRRSCLCSPGCVAATQQSSPARSRLAGCSARGLRRGNAFRSRRPSCRRGCSRPRSLPRSCETVTGRLDGLDR